VFVAQIDIRALNNLLTDNNGWRSTGQGETGEVLLTGEDHLMLRERAIVHVAAKVGFLHHRIDDIARGCVHEVES
jgi:hypothetical protein